ncbi:lipopolysaccharide core heptose(II)-phosphate phosphatase PmrG [Pseudomonas sp. Marseille-QA0892]
MSQTYFLSSAQRWWVKLSSARRKYTFAAVLGAVFGVALVAFLLHPPEIADLSEESRHELPDLLAQWDKGNVIVLLRHLERCDKEDSPCLEGTEGITARSVGIGQLLADSYTRLGLANTTILNSPLTRTAQTESIVFADVGADMNWLYECRNTMLSDALAHKAPGKNLVLVTHSSCIEAFEQALGYDSDTPAYGASLFFSADARSGSLRVLGYLDADDWDIAVGPSSTSVANRDRLQTEEGGVL